MRFPIPHRLVVLFACALMAAGCSPGHDVPLYNVWVVNHESDDRLIVLGNNPDGASTQPAQLIPADGVTRSTYGSTMSSVPGAIAAIHVYDAECTLLERVEVQVGSYLLTLRGGEALLAELSRSMELTGAEFAADAPFTCPGGAPP